MSVLSDCSQGASPPDVSIDHHRLEAAASDEGSAGARRIGRLIGTVGVPGLVVYLVIRSNRRRSDSSRAGTTIHYGDAPPPTSPPQQYPSAQATPGAYPPPTPGAYPPPTPGTYPPPPPPPT